MGKLFRLLIPRKGSADTTDLDTNWRAIERWAQNVGGIVEITSKDASVTITDPFGPVTDLSAAGGGSIGTVASPFGTIDVTHPHGPTVDVDVHGVPFLPYSDSHDNVGYGLAVFSVPPSGSANSAFGWNALHAVTSGGENTGLGSAAGVRITSGTGNTCVGNAAGDNITTGTENVAIGDVALNALVVGSNNVAVGHSTLPDFGGSDSTAVGWAAGASITDGTDNLFLGKNTGTAAASTYHGVVAIGTDHLNAGAKAGHDDDFVLGTDKHTIVFSNTQTGSSIQTLGSNSPGGGGDPTAWIQIRDGNTGTIGYIPYWT